MRKLEFNIEQSRVFSYHDAAYLGKDGEPTGDALREAVIECLSTDLQVTVSGVTMFLAAWLDPDHWAEDWKAKLDCDDAGAAVAELLSQAVTEDSAQRATPISATEVLSNLHDGSGRFIGSATVPWRCGICRELIFPPEVHQHEATEAPQ